MGAESEKRARLNKAVRYFRILLRIGLAFVFLIFVRTLLQEFPYPQLESLNARLTLKSALVLYMYCWFFGCNFDLSVQQDIYIDAPDREWQDTGVYLVVVVGFSLLFALEDLRWLAVMFLVFLGINVVGWIYLKGRVYVCVEDAVQHYRHHRDALGLVRASIFKDYMFGRWQWRRFAVGVFMLTVLVLITFGVLPPVAGLGGDILFALGVAITIVVLESWVWIRRGLLKARWDGLDWMKENGFNVGFASMKERADP